MWFDPARLAPPANFANFANLTGVGHVQEREIRKIREIRNPPHPAKLEQCQTGKEAAEAILESFERKKSAPAVDPVEAAPPAKPAPVPACRTCQHRPPGYLATAAAPCGDPVAAGLADLPGVIRYHPDDGKTCPAWRAWLDPDLERRILAMAERWSYSGDELALVMEGTRSDPDGWRRVVEVDEWRW